MVSQEHALPITRSECNKRLVSRRASPEKIGSEGVDKCSFAFRPHLVLSCSFSLSSSLSLLDSRSLPPLFLSLLRALFFSQIKHQQSSKNQNNNKYQQQRSSPLPPRAQMNPLAAAASASAAPTSEKKLWGGRFTGATDPLMEKFNASIGSDKRMWREDIEGSQAYARALSKTAVLTEGEAAEIVAGLDAVAAEWRAGTFEIKAGDEDIHTANERRLTELIGAVGGKLHTGRSRNDQVSLSRPLLLPFPPFFFPPRRGPLLTRAPTPALAHRKKKQKKKVATDTRLWLARHLREETRVHLGELLRAAALRAEAEADVVMPGFTHLQPAQVVRWSHWLLSHASAWQRDAQRLGDLLPRVETLPLGSGALAGNPFGVDRRAISLDLGFGGRVCPNSMDAVSDRDFVLDTLYFCAVTMVHLSRWAEDLIIYSSGAFG